MLLFIQFEIIWPEWDWVLQILFSIQYSVIRVSLILIHWLQTSNVASSAIAWSMCLQDWLHYSSELNQDKRISFKVNLRQKSCILRYQDLWKPRQGKVWSHNLMEAFCDRYATMVSLPWVAWAGSTPLRGLAECRAKGLCPRSEVPASLWHERRNHQVIDRGFCWNLCNPECNFKYFSPPGANVKLGPKGLIVLNKQ